MYKASGFTRQEILNSIKLHGPMAADELGKELGISPVAARQHLSSLESEGYIVTNVDRRNLGRPVHRYAMTAQGDELFPRMYDMLANQLLDELRFSQGDEAVEALFQSRMQRSRDALMGRTAGKPIIERAIDIAQFRTEMGYMAETKIKNNVINLVEHNCSICNIARNYPYACNMELQLITELFEDSADVKRSDHILSGGNTCTYLITPHNLDK